MKMGESAESATEQAKGQNQLQHQSLSLRSSAPVSNSSPASAKRAAFGIRSSSQSSILSGGQTILASDADHLRPGSALYSAMLKRAAFASRTSSRSSILSTSQPTLLSDTEHFASRPGTPTSLVVTDSSVFRIRVRHMSFLNFHYRTHPVSGRFHKLHKHLGKRTAKEFESFATSL